MPARPREHHCLAPGPPRCAQGGAHARAAPALPLHHLGPPYGGWGRPFWSNPTDSGDLRPEDLASNSLPGRFRPGNFVGPTGGYRPSFLRSLSSVEQVFPSCLQSPRAKNPRGRSVTLLPGVLQPPHDHARARARWFRGGKGVAGSEPQQQRAGSRPRRSTPADIPATNQSAVLSPRHGRGLRRAKLVGGAPVGAPHALE